MQAAIYGCAGPRLTADERAFFREADPWGFILFARNVEDPAQVGRLCADLRESVGRDAPILIDQEGGRVARLRPPHWPAYPPARRYGALHAEDPEAGAAACRLGAQLIGLDLAGLGIDVNCIPLADVPQAGAHDVIGDRAYGSDPQTVIALARATAQGLEAAGVLPVLKHLPGHGRAGVDSHEELPVVDAPLAALRDIDFAPFAALADLPLGMTAHVVYTAVDAGRPATTSPAVLRMVREEIGFGGLLMTDDLSMKALGGPMAERVAESLAAGCDLVLHCNGDMAEMQAVAEAAPALTGAALERSQTALSRRKSLDPADAEAIRAEWEKLLGASA